jgi:hypothetical protein
LTNSAQLNLVEPQQVDWNNVSGASTYTPPPQVVGGDGKPVTFTGVIKNIEERANQFAVDEEGRAYLNFLIDPIELVDAGRYNGYTLRFTEASTKPFKNGKSNRLALFVAASGSTGKPQTNDQYRQVVKALTGKRVRFTGEWEARSKDTGEKVKGYSNFPDDPDRPGEKKAILKKGDTYTVSDFKGNILETKTVQAEVIFANLVVRNFIDPTRSR